MPKRNDGNEQDLRIRPSADAPSLEGDNPFTGARPEGAGPCDEHGTQTNLPVEVEPPDGSSFSFDWSDQTNYCPEGFSNRSVNTLLMGILKSHFFFEENIIQEAIKRFTWNPDPALSNIRIVMNTTWDAAQAGKLPAIVIKRGGQKQQRVVFNDKGETGDPVYEGTTRHVRFVQGSHRILCMAETDGETESLVEEVNDLLSCVSPVIRSDLPMHDFQVTTLSEVGTLDDVGGSLAAVVEVAYSYEYAWTLKRIGPTLSGTTVGVDAELSFGTDLE